MNILYNSAFSYIRFVGMEYRLNIHSLKSVMTHISRYQPVMVVSKPKKQPSGNLEEAQTWLVFDAPFRNLT